MVKELIEYDSHQLTKVISGGQCGADRGGIAAASVFGISTGGFAPKGWRTSHGPDPSLEKLGLRETFSNGYQDRTRMNVEAADGTLAIATNFNSPGEILTSKCCVQLKKPLLQLSPSVATTPAGVAQIVRFIISNNIRILNVAGNRDYKDSDTPQLHHNAAYFAVLNTLIMLRDLSN